VGDRDQPRLLADQLLDVLHRHAAVGIGLGLVEREELLGRHPGERAVDRVVLGARRDDVVALPEEALEGEVQAVGGVEREDDAVGALRAEEPRDGLAAALDPFLRLDGQAVARATGVPGMAAGELVHRAVDGFWLRPRGGGVVQVDHGAHNSAATRE
jgi:hypothetical protein